MLKKLLLIITSLVLACAAVSIGWLLMQGNDIAVLTPQGPIAEQQYDLIIFTTLLSLIIIIPVFALTFYIVWKYRASNKKVAYSPEWSSNRLIEAIWWLVPLALIIVLAVLTWISSHRLDPYRPIESNKKPITVQVVALQWKWLFIYPDQDIATVNYIQFPENTPINFELTADAPMNSFWIPKLGGQVYAMPGMETKLHLEASRRGEYRGASANISGEGFAGMKFMAKATSQSDFDSWVKKVKSSSKQLDQETYTELAKPSKDHQPIYYSSRDPALYDTIMMKYMHPDKHQDHSISQHEQNHGEGMHH